MFVLIALCLAFWFKWEFFSFANRINQQVYQEYNSLVSSGLSESEFLTQSRLQPKASKWTNLFFFCFPFIALFSESVWIGAIFILLCYLSVLDCCYYLTDIRYISAIVIFVLCEKFIHFHHDTLLFTGLFCVFIGLFSQYFLKKEGFGVGDMLLLIALSPLFNLEKMLLLILIASISGIIVYWLFFLWKKQKLEKLPFVPFISLAMLILMVLERNEFS